MTNIATPPCAIEDWLSVSPANCAAALENAGRLIEIQGSLKGKVPDALYARRVGLAETVEGDPRKLPDMIATADQNVPKTSKAKFPTLGL